MAKQMAEATDHPLRGESRRQLVALSASTSPHAQCSGGNVVELRMHDLKIRAMQGFLSQVL